MNKDQANSNTSKIAQKISFSATEAFKRLRTNIMFSFAGDKKCKTIGVTSSIRHEGKTTVSSYLAKSFADAGLRVLLIDGDLRLPTVHKIMGIEQSPGLSNMLSSTSNPEVFMRQPDASNELYVITSGDISPNPIELFMSSRMKSMLESAVNVFDYIIIDLPPVGIVADALLISELVDGMLVVVRPDYTDKKSFAYVVSELEYHKANIIGFVMNDADIEKNYGNKKYGRYYKYGKYYKSGKDHRKQTN